MLGNLKALALVFVFVPVGSFLTLARADTGNIPGESEIGHRFTRQLILTAPFSVPRLSFLHATLEVPPLEPARLLPPGNLYIRVTTSHAGSFKEQEIGGVESDFDGVFHEWAALDASLGVFSHLDIAARIVVSGWDEKMDLLTILDENGYPIVRYEALEYYGTGVSARNSSVSKIVVRGKTPLFSSKNPTFDLAFAASGKFPIGRAQNLTNAGTTDLNFLFLGSFLMNPVTFHINAGIGIPLGEQNLFVEEAGVDLNHFFQAGVGANWQINTGLALGIQLEANTTAFRDVPFLDYPAVTLFGGLRKLFGNLVVEGGVGSRLVHQGSYNWEYYLSVGYQFGLLGKHPKGVATRDTDYAMER